MHNLRLIIALLIWPSVSLADEQVMVDQTKLAACMDMAGGKDRLACYREVPDTSRPFRFRFPDTASAFVMPSPPGPEQLACYDSLFRSGQTGSPTTHPSDRR